MPPDERATLLGMKWSPIAESAADLVDCFEVAGWAAEGPPHDDRPVLLHNLDLDFSLAAPDPLDIDWFSRCSKALAATGSPWFSAHLGFSAERVRFDGHMLPLSAPLTREICIERFFSVLDRMQEGLPVPLLIENLDYCPEGAYEHICEPDFIAAVVDRLDCGLLLDIAHARVSADWLGWDIDDYLDHLPLHKACEIHLSSPRPGGGRLDDLHFELLDVDVALLEHVLSVARPRAVVLEYTRDAGLLRSQLMRLRDVISRHCSVK